MPVKLTESGEPLAKVQEKPAVPLQAPPANVVDQLLENADEIPEAPAQQAKQVAATAEVGTFGKDGAITVDTTEKVPVWLSAPDNYAGPYGKLTYGMQATINTGNFENLRPFVQIEVPFIPGQQEAAYAYAEDWVDTRITNIITNTKKGVSGA